MRTRSLLLVVLTVLLLTIPDTTSAAAITRTVADRFEITVGYLYEPAILGDTNAMRISIQEDGEPISGIGGDLVAQVEFMDAVRVLNVVESSTEPGVYTGTFIPMMDGEYTFVLSGTIDGVEINERYTVQDGLVNVLPRTDFEFPNTAHGFLSISKLAMPAAAIVLTGLLVIGWRKRA